MSSEEARALIFSGACDGLGPSRPAMLWQLSIRLQTARLRELERQYLTFSPANHPLAILADTLAGQDIVRSIDLAGFIGRQVFVAGIIVATRKAVTRQRDMMQFITLEDRWGLVEVVLFPDVYKQLGGTFGRFGPYLVRGAVQENLGSIVLVGCSVQLIPDLPPPAGQHQPQPALIVWLTQHLAGYNT